MKSGRAQEYKQTHTSSSAISSYHIEPNISHNQWEGAGQDKTPSLSKSENRKEKDQSLFRFVKISLESWPEFCVLPTKLHNIFLSKQVCTQLKNNNQTNK